MEFSGAINYLPLNSFYMKFQNIMLLSSWKTVVGPKTIVRTTEILKFQHKQYRRVNNSVDTYPVLIISLERRNTEDSQHLYFQGRFYAKDRIYVSP